MNEVEKLTAKIEAAQNTIRNLREAKTGKSRCSVKEHRKTIAALNAQVPGLKAQVAELRRELKILSSAYRLGEIELGHLQQKHSLSEHHFEVAFASLDRTDPLT